MERMSQKDRHYKAQAREEEETLKTKTGCYNHPEMRDDTTPETTLTTTFNNG
jgi:hypothetical protein